MKIKKITNKLKLMQDGVELQSASDCGTDCPVYYGKTESIYKQIKALGIICDTKVGTAPASDINYCKNEFGYYCFRGWTAKISELL